MGSIKQYLIETHDLSQQLELLARNGSEEQLSEEELQLCQNTRLRLSRMDEIDRTVYTQVEQLAKRVVPPEVWEEYV